MTPAVCVPAGFDARLCVGFRMFTECYTSRVRLHPHCDAAPDTMRIEAAAVDGSSSFFERLNSTWEFRRAAPDAPDGSAAGGEAGWERAERCEVRFAVDFQASSFSVDLALDSFFEEVCLCDVLYCDRPTERLTERATPSPPAAHACTPARL